MIYGPMTKMVAESTELKYATRCSLGYTFASFFGSPLAGLVATYFSWQATFNVSSTMLIIMSVIGFICFTLLEKKGIVKYGTPQKGNERTKKDYKGLFKRNIVKFAGIAMLTGIIRTSFVGFLTTYFCDYLKYTENKSASIFSLATLIISFTTFIAVFVYEKLNKNVHICVLIFFSAAALFFCAAYFITHPIANIALIIIAIMASNASSTMLWSVYCPSLRDTGLVSGITGFLDFLSYSTAAIASLFISHVVETITWHNIVIIMAGLMVIGIAICIPCFLRKASKSYEAE
jgi:predicted MFS family arabinose efflux permease